MPNSVGANFREFFRQPARLGASLCRTWSSALLLALLLSACGGEDATSETPATTAPTFIPEVQTHTLTPQTLQTSITTFGAIEALEEVDVAAELSGTVAVVHVNEGDRVSAGQPLLELDAQKRELALQQARRQVERSKAALEEARLKLERRRNLAEKETISQEILDNAQLAVDASRAAHEQSLAALQLAERELADTRIVSPTDGVVDIRAVEPGEPVQAGAALITLQAVAALRVQTWVSEADVVYLRPGNPARVVPSGMPNREFPARIEWVGVKADRQTGNFPVKLIMESGLDTLRPGMTVSSTIQGLSIAGALVLPEAALVDHQRRRVVFVEQDGIAHLREPVLAAGLSNHLLILAGLDSGDRVITRGQQRLVEGARVQVSAAE